MKDKSIYIQNLARLTMRLFYNVVIFPIPPTSHEHHFYGVTSGLTGLKIEPIMFARMLIFKAIKLCDKIFHLKNLAGREKEKEL